MKENIIKFFAKITPTWLKKIRRRIIRELENKRFKYKNNSIAGEMRRGELNWLFLTAKKMNSVVEIGSWKGRSTHALLSGCKGTVYAVDHFKWVKGEQICSYEKALQENIFQEFLKNVGHFENLKVYKMDSLQVARKFKDKSVDMVFIDADHSYEAVKADIEAWLPKVKKLICGHDYEPKNWPGVKQAVDEKFGKVNTVYNIWFHYL